MNDAQVQEKQVTKARRTGLLILVAAMSAGLLLGGSLAYRSHVSAQERAAIRDHDLQVVTVVCVRLHRLDLAIQGLVTGGASKEALSKYQYYRDHPGEMKVAGENAKRMNSSLAKADCTPSELGLEPTGAAQTSRKRATHPGHPRTQSSAARTLTQPRR